MYYFSNDNCLDSIQKYKRWEVFCVKSILKKNQNVCGIREEKDETKNGSKRKLVNTVGCFYIKVFVVRLSLQIIYNFDSSVAVQKEDFR
jgi:hypothetical protein